MTHAAPHDPGRDWWLHWYDARDRRRTNARTAARHRKRYGGYFVAGEQVIGSAIAITLLCGLPSKRKHRRRP